MDSWRQDLQRTWDAQIEAVFIQLLAVLKRDAGVRSTRYVSAEEQLGTFLHYVHRGLPNRALQERFQRSGDTISKCVVLNILGDLECNSEYVYKIYTSDPGRAHI
jgi:hypothetical protein